MGRSRTKDAAGKPITFERVEELFSFLQGDEIEGIHCDNMPALSKLQAYSVIYFLQEHIEILPDEIEQCGECEELIHDEQSDRLSCTSPDDPALPPISKTRHRQE